MSKLIIADLEHSIDLDRAAMRAIVGLGARPSWKKQPTAFFLIHTSKSTTGTRAAAGRWHEFLRPMSSEPSRSHMNFWRPGRTPTNGSQ